MQCTRKNRVPKAPGLAFTKQSTAWSRNSCWNHNCALRCRSSPSSLQRRFCMFIIDVLIHLYCLKICITVKVPDWPWGYQQRSLFQLRPDMVNIAVLRIGSFVFGFVGGIILTSSLLSYHWCRTVEKSHNQTVIIHHRGLWEACVEIGIESRCRSVSFSGEGQWKFFFRTVAPLHTLARLGEMVLQKSIFKIT